MQCDAYGLVLLLSFPVKSVLNLKFDTSALVAILKQALLDN
jgi:hypothetical protein